MYEYIHKCFIFLLKHGEVDVPNCLGIYLRCNYSAWLTNLEDTWMILNGSYPSFCVFSFSFFFAHIFCWDFL